MRCYLDSLYNDFTIFPLRRKDVIESIRAEYPVKGMRLVIFVRHLSKIGKYFAKKVSFYYFTGITEPAVVVILDLKVKSLSIFLNKQ